MLLRLDGPEEDHRASRTLSDALKAQLTLLDGFFPLQGWMVAHCRHDKLNVLATRGAWSRRGDTTVLGDIMGDDSWAACSEHPGFQYRSLNDTEGKEAGVLLSDASPPDCIIRHPLRDPEGVVQAWLIGIATDQAIRNVLGPDFPVEYVTQTIVGMALCMTLHVELESVRHQLTELQHNAFIEPLTRVLNRAGWINRVQHLEAIISRSDEDVAIVMLDLDLLKLVNDLDGHSAGDELLQLTAQTIQSVVRASDVVGRLGGDEFGVAVRGVTRPMANAMIQRLRAALDDVGVNVSMGMAMKSETDSLDETFILADQRMYQEKRAKPIPDRAMDWQRGAVHQDTDTRI